MADELTEGGDSVAGARLRELYDDCDSDVPVSFEELREAAREQMPDDAFAYLAGGAGTEDTMSANRAAFRRWRLTPRVLRDISERSLTVELFGRRFAAPFLFAPAASQRLFAPDGELATARAARSLDLPLVLSSGASTDLEAVAEVMGETPRWFQLYWSSNRDLSASLIGRAEAAGYEAIVLTVDSSVPGWRERLLERAYQPIYDGIDVANYTSDPVFRAQLPDGAGRETVLEQYASMARDPSLTWEDLDAVREMTDLPILIKGITHPDDAERAVAAGVDGIIVSNHGGRQLDGALASLVALQRVVTAVDKAIPVLFDSGIRRGTDALKALAFGADAVLVGRPYLFGLALAGEDGVREVMRNLLADFDLAMAQCGCTKPEQLSESLLVDTRD